MRDFQDTYRYDSSYYLRREYVVNFSATVEEGSLPGATDSGTYPVFTKGRANLVIGSPPAPTPYYAFRIKTVPVHAENQSGINYYYAYWYGYGWIGVTEYIRRLRMMDRGSLLWGLSSFSEDGKTGYKPNVSAATVAKAIERANARLRSDSINIGQTVGEMPEAIREFSKLVKSAAKTLLALKRGNLPRAQYHLGTILGRRQAIKKTQGISDTYLFYRFGVAPILNDINHMADAIGKALSAPDFIKIRATAYAEVPLSGSYGLWREGSVEEVCEVGYSVRPTSNYPAAFLGLTNPLATAWELVPLSFVANWFVSIGETLSALDAGIGLEWVSGYQTTVHRGNYKVGDNKDLGYNISKSYFDVDSFAMERRVLTRPLVPPIYLKLGGLGAGQLTTLSAMLFSAVNGEKFGSIKK